MSYGGKTLNTTGGAGGHEAARAASPPAGTGAVPAAESETVANNEPDARAEQEPKTARQKLRAFYNRNFGLFLIFLAEIFASLVSQPVLSCPQGIRARVRWAPPKSPRVID